MPGFGQALLRLTDSAQQHFSMLLLQQFSLQDGAALFLNKINKCSQADRDVSVACVIKR